MRKFVLLLIYFAVVIRAIAFHFYDDPVPPLTYLFLAIYGLLLATQPALTRRYPRYTPFYLAIQFALVMAAQLTTPSMDFIISLLFPLSFQAVFYYGRRVGFIIITAFLLMLFFPIMTGWEWQIEGFAVVFVNGAACYLVGNFAHLILTAERANLANQQLSIELQNANQKLHAAAAQRQELAVLQERGRMARELHDSVTQTIFSMNLSVQSARMLADKDMSLVTEQLDRLQELARSAVSEVQVLISQLRPASLDSGQLSQALGELVRQRQVQDGLQIDLQVIAERPLPQPAIQGLYRIVQEALNNIVKHAGTNQASIRVDLQARPAYVEISDQGCGFDPDSTAGDSAHLGLTGMASRAAELGWKFHLDSQPGAGTLIRLEEIPT